MSEANMLILDPTGSVEASGLQLAPRPVDLRGKTVGVVDNGMWLSFAVVVERYKELLKEHYGVSDVIYVNLEKEGVEKGKARRQECIDELALKVDVVFTGLGN